MIIKWQQFKFEWIISIKYGNYIENMNEWILCFHDTFFYYENIYPILA